MKIAKLIGKVLFCAVAFIVGTAVSGSITAALHLPQMQAPAGTNQRDMILALLLSSPLLIVGIGPIAAGLGKRFATRFAAIFLILYVTIGINTIIEASVFSNMVTAPLLVMFVNCILPSVFAALAVAWCFGSKENVNGLPRFTAVGWAWRIAVAWVAFPVIYWTFGMCVAPFVVPYYKAGVAGLTIPPFSVILKTQLIRSPLFLLASLPLVALWTRSRRELFLTLGLAHAVMVGIYGLAQATFFPTVLRVVHSIEITFDSFAYAGVLVLLFTASKHAAERIPENPKAAAAGN